MSKQILQEKIAVDKPEDFDNFWRATLYDLNQNGSGYELTLQDRRTNIEHHSVEFDSWNNTKIFGYCLHWNDARTRPLLIYTHGYNGQCQTQWEWAEMGFNVVGFDTRGFGRSTTSTHPDGWRLTGIESPETSILRGAICDYVRATEIARQITQAKTSRTLYYGFSFGGAMALIAEALNQSADLVAAGVPSLGWMAGRRKLVKLGSGHEINRYIRKNPAQEQNIMRTLSYFDTANFATAIKKPTLIGIGLNDIVVPKKTVRAICQHLHCPHVIREFPFSHSNQPEEKLWQNFDDDWQQMGLTGHLPSE